MTDSMFSTLVEFFGAIGSQKAHWYRVFEPGIDKSSYSLIKSTFSCLASLMKMESDYIQQLLIEVGLARKRMQKYACIVYPDHNTWDSFIKKYLLDMETMFFTTDKKRHLYIKIGVWCNSMHLPRTPASI